MIEVPSFTLSVICDIAPNIEKASFPHDSGVQIESTFSFLSANDEKDRTSFGLNREPILNPIFNDDIYFYEEFLDNSFDDSSISLCESIDFQNEFSKFFAFNFCSFAIAGKAVVSIFPLSGR
jgi:hypothetical protein